MPSRACPRTLRRFSRNCSELRGRPWIRIPAFGDLCVTPPVGDSVVEMASSPSGEPPPLDSRLRGNDGCARISFRGYDGGCVCVSEWRVVVIPAPEPESRGGKVNVTRSTGSASRGLLFLTAATGDVVHQRIGGVRVPAGEPPPLDSRLRGNDGCARVSLRGNDGCSKVFFRGYDGRVCRRLGVESSRHSGPRAGIQRCGSQAQWRPPLPRRNPRLEFCQVSEGGRRQRPKVAPLPRLNSYVFSSPLTGED